MDTSILELAWALSPYAICGEGNVSVRDDESFWMKASGASLTNLETGFHAWILREFEDINFIAHTHPTKTMQVLCSEQIYSFADHRLFPDQVVRNGAKSCVVPYAMPGKPLLEQINKYVTIFVEEYQYFPKLILLENHGIITASSSHKECIASTMMCEKSAEIFIGSKVLGQTNFLTDDQVSEIDKCPSEKHRRKMYQ